MTNSASTSQASEPMRTQVTNFVKSLQSSIVEAFESLDPNHPFIRDSWVRSEGGFGTSCVLSGGTILEKAGVNVSVVHGRLPPAAVKQMRVNHQKIPDAIDGKGLPFFAAGISLVIHPHNPMAPTVHANYRYFEVTQGGKDGEEDGEIAAWWFGGGSDLTPSYLYEEDAIHFHSVLRDACHQHLSHTDSATASETGLYTPFKTWCDEYFYIPHRSESRGLGGIFFDDLNGEPHPRLSEQANSVKPSTPETIFQFLRNCGEAFVPSYLPILKKRRDEPFTEENRRWQLLRRGRYVEFNLVYDRGTKFGLNTPSARIESILMSLPETARWEYMSDMGKEGTEEGKLMEYLRKPKQWL